MAAKLVRSAGVEPAVTAAASPEAGVAVPEKAYLSLSQPSRIAKAIPSKK